MTWTLEGSRQQRQEEAAMGATGVVVVLLAVAQQAPDLSPANPAAGVDAAAAPASPARAAGSGLPSPDARPALEPELPVAIDFVNSMGKSFRLVELELSIDGARVERRVADKDGELPRRFPAWKGPVTPGPHTLTATLVFKGRNRGVFTYVDGYTARVESRQRFVVGPERAVALTVTADERRDPTLPLMEKAEVSITGDAVPAPSQPALTSPPAPAVAR
jgi:hypothetical protein